jgi:uncharacterized lipoprotein YmbA
MNRRSMALLALVLLAACGSAPATRFHTLLAPPSDASAPAKTIAWELLPVTIPAQADQPQLVVRAGDGSLALLEHERWIAPLADEYRAALAERLTQALGPALPAGASARADAKLWRIRVDVQRFDSAPGRYARQEVSWGIDSGLAGAPALACRSVLEQPAEDGYPALAAAHRQDLARLAQAIAAAVLALDAGQAATCPQSV